MTEILSRGMLATGLFGDLPGAGNVPNDPGDAVDVIITFIGNLIVVLFVVVVIFSIIYAILSGIKYIQSQGASDKVEEASEAIKNVLIGIVVAFVGTIVVVLISAGFGIDATTGENGAARKAIVCLLRPLDPSCGNTNGGSTTPTPIPNVPEDQVGPF
jgi:hypothetical protein